VLEDEDEWLEHDCVAAFYSILIKFSDYFVEKNFLRSSWSFLEMILGYFEVMSCIHAPVTKTVKS